MEDGLGEFGIPKGDMRVGEFLRNDLGSTDESWRGGESGRVSDGVADRMRQLPISKLGPSRNRLEDDVETFLY